MSNLRKYFEQYDIKPRDTDNYCMEHNKKREILKSSISVKEIEYFNNDPVGIIVPNVATEIIAMGYILSERAIPPNFDVRDEAMCFVVRFSFHGKLKDTDIDEQIILTLIDRRFQLAKDKYDIRLMDHAFSNFYKIFFREAPNDLVQFIVDNEGIGALPKDQLNDIVHNTKINNLLREQVHTLVELIS